MLFNEELDLCHSEGAERPKNPCRFFPFTEPVLSAMRFFPFTEPVLSAMRFFPFTTFRVRMTVSEGSRVRMTASEGFRIRMTNGIAMLSASTRYNRDNLKRQCITEIQNEYTYLALLPVVD